MTDWLVTFFNPDTGFTEISIKAETCIDAFERGSKFGMVVAVEEIEQ